MILKLLRDIHALLEAGWWIHQESPSVQNVNSSTGSTPWTLPQPRRGNHSQQGSHGAFRWDGGRARRKAGVVSVTFLSQFPLDGPVMSQCGWPGEDFFFILLQACPWSKAAGTLGNGFRAWMPRTLRMRQFMELNMEVWPWMGWSKGSVLVFFPRKFLLSLWFIFLVWYYCNYNNIIWAQEGNLQFHQPFTRESAKKWWYQSWHIDLLTPSWHSPGARCGDHWTLDLPIGRLGRVQVLWTCTGGASAPSEAGAATRCNQCCSQNMFPPTIIPSTGEISHIYSILTTKNAWFMVIHSSGLAGFHEVPFPDHYAWVHPCHSGDSWLWYCIHRSQCSCHLVSTCSPGWRFYVGHGGDWGESWHSVTLARPIRVLCTVNVSLCTSLV